MTDFEFFNYKNDILHCEDASLHEITEKLGSPIYVYSHAALVNQFKRMTNAFAGVDHLICFSMKANSSLAILRTFINEGSGIDVVSGGELQRAIIAGCDPKKIVFSGVGKTSEEILFALRQDILQFNVESEMELDNIQRVAAFADKKAPIALRVNPDVDAKTHPYISTGLKQNKFGISHTQALQVYQKAKKMSHIEIVGIDCHIGSQLIDISPFTDAMTKVRELIDELAAAGITLNNIDIGGGLGIRYSTESPASAEAYANAVLGPLKGLEARILLEPGRFLVGNAGVLVSRVIYLKDGEDQKKFLIVDAAFNDLMRPALYEAWHEILPVKKTGLPEHPTDVVGPICETGDCFAKDRPLPQLEPGELISFMSAGAYGLSMASTYNSRPRPSEVLVKGRDFFVIRKADKMEHITGRETLPEFLKDRS